MLQVRLTAGRKRPPGNWQGPLGLMAMNLGAQQQTPSESVADAGQARVFIYLDHGLTMEDFENHNDKDSKTH